MASMVGWDRSENRKEVGVVKILRSVSMKKMRAREGSRVAVVLLEIEPSGELELAGDEDFNVA